MNVILGIMGQCDARVDPIKYMLGQCPLFHGPVILPYILKTICGMFNRKYHYH